MVLETRRTNYTLVKLRDLPILHGTIRRLARNFRRMSENPDPDALRMAGRGAPLERLSARSTHECERSATWAIFAHMSADHVAHVAVVRGRSLRRPESLQ